jgi:small conductance mechanosensitive channel
MIENNLLTEKYIDYAVKLAIDFAPKLLLAIVSLLVGLWIISKITKTFKKIAVSKDWDASLIPFVGGIISAILKVVLFISVASLIGIQTTSFVAVLGAASLAVGLALQGSLSNFAGGVLILMLKPYKVGDEIEAQGYTGNVTEIQIFNTLLLTADGKSVILPNGSISNGSIVNYSNSGIRRIDLLIKLSYKDDHEKAKRIIRNLLEAYPEVHADPAPMVEVIELLENQVVLCVRPTVDTENYGLVKFKLLAEIKTAFQQEGFDLPIPQYERSAD